MDSGYVLKIESVSRLCCSSLFNYCAYLRNVTGAFIESGCLSRLVFEVFVF